MALYRDFPGNYATSFTNTAGGNAALPSNKLFIGSTADDASGALLQVTGGVTVTGLLTQTFTGTTTNALSITANSLTSGNAFYTSTSSTARTVTAPSTTTASNSLVAAISNGANATKSAYSIGYYAHIANTGNTPLNYSFYSSNGLLYQADTTDNTLGTVASGSIQTAGGVGIAKNLTVGTGLTLNADANLRMTSGTGYFQQVYVNSSATAAAYQANTISSTRSGAVNSVSADYNYALTVTASRTSAVSALALYDYGVNAYVTGQAIASQNVYGGQFSGYIPSSTLGTIYGGLFSSSGGATSYGIYSTASGGTTNYSFYGGAGTLYNAGNVLIGTTTDDTSNRLQVVASGKDKARFSNSDYVAGTTGTLLQLGQSVSTGNGVSVISSFVNGGGMVGPLALNQGGGNVLIGTTASNTALVAIDGGGAATLSNSTGFFQIGNSAGNNIVVDYNKIQSRNNASSNVLLVNPLGGNVLIGTATDNVGKLQVFGTGTTNAYYANGDAAGSTLYLQDSSASTNSGGSILFGSAFGVSAQIKMLLQNGTGPAGDLIYSTRSSSGNVVERMRITSTGNVQVGGPINPTSEVWFNPTGASKAISWGGVTAGGLNGTYSRIYDAGNLTIATDDTVEFRHITAATGAVGNVVASFNLTDTTGSFTATSKSFDIRDPRQEDEDVRLVHGSLEGPEFGVYYRGKSKLVDGVTIINLPDYFESLVDLENRTVILTPVFVSDETISQLASSEVVNGQFTVKCTDNNNLSQSFFWEAKAFRKDIPPLEVEKIRVPKVRT